jgi:hypothetical protein
MYRCRQYLSGKEPGHDMPMIRHDAPRKEPIAFLIKVAQGIGQFFWDGGILQVTSACATVEEALNHWSREARDFRAFVGAEVTPKTDGRLDDGLPLGFDALED